MWYLYIIINYSRRIPVSVFFEKVRIRVSDTYRIRYPYPYPCNIANSARKSYYSRFRQPSLLAPASTQSMTSILIVSKSRSVVESRLSNKRAFRSFHRSQTIRMERVSKPFRRSLACSCRQWVHHSRIVCWLRMKEQLQSIAEAAFHQTCLA